MLITLGKKIFDFIPAKSPLLLKAAQRYVDRFNGDNNSDPTSNGEELFLNSALSKLPSSAVIFDVGANVGEWSTYCLRIAPALAIHQFEPSAFTFAKLRSTKWPTSVTLNNIGLGDSNAELLLNIAGDGSGMNSIHRRHGVAGVEMATTETVKIITLDSYCELNKVSRIDLLKVDVEGHELAVFKGAQQLLARGGVDIIQFEYGGCNLDSRVYLLDIWNLLAPLGYSFYKLYSDGPRHVAEYSQALETFRYSNWLAVHRGKML